MLGAKNYLQELGQTSRIGRFLLNCPKGLRHQEWRMKNLIRHHALEDFQSTGLACRLKNWAREARLSSSPAEGTEEPKLSRGILLMGKACSLQYSNLSILNKFILLYPAIIKKKFIKVHMIKALLSLRSCQICSTLKINK